MLAPNKQNLILLKSQKKLVSTGHKLLKEKRSGLIATFLDMANKGKAFELELRKELQKIMQTYFSNLTFVSSQSLLDYLEIKPSINLLTQKKRVSGVYVDNLDLEIKLPERPNLKNGLKTSLAVFGKFFAKLLKLSQFKLNTSRIAKEILKTNRQISNLEKKIESIEGEVKFIKNALNEKSNLEKATLIKMAN